MNKKAESVRFVAMTTAALILIGLMFITFGGNGAVSGSAVYTKTSCYLVNDGELTTADVSKCCLAIRNSDGCKEYDSREIRDELYICSSAVMNKETIEFCS